MPASPRVRAPEIGPDAEWHNVAAPLSLQALRGRVVLLDFWTHCCINCLHVLEDLKRLEREFGDRLVVLGIHSAKFPNERRSESLAAAIQRLEIAHPVVNDAEFMLWQQYAIQAWPTLVLIDPQGYVIGQETGEGKYELLRGAITRLLEMNPAQSLDDHSLGPFSPPAEAAGPLSFPGKVLYDGATERVFIADTNHHRLLVCDRNGRVDSIVGTGYAGDEDGSLADASFRRPQGMAVDGKHLFVADTGNHMIRYCNLDSGRVATAAGTGEQSRDYGRWGTTEALETPLSSPWDVLLHAGHVYIAMAGPHQLWRLDLARDEIGPYSGSGREDCRDGSAQVCAMAQPSGLTSDGDRIFVADSETSSIRAVQLGDGGEVSTLVGQGLFEFGDTDGRAGKARLQHPMGVSFADGALYIADTFNHKIKKLEPRTRRVTTILGGAPGHSDGVAARFNEPAGLSVAEGLIWIADTNNHRVCVVEVGSQLVETFKLRF